jgi:hypothetical protein
MGRHISVGDFFFSSCKPKAKNWQMLWFLITEVVFLCHATCLS